MTNTDNPHDFTPDVIADLHKTSLKMYDAFYDLLATYQFEFNREQKEWLLQSIVKDIRAVNNDDENNEDDLAIDPDKVVE